MGWGPGQRERSELHILIVFGTTEGHTAELARFAAETSYRAAPDDETSRLDMIAVAAATGHAELAQRQLVEEVFNRSDDGLGPAETPPRTGAIVRQRGWDRRQPVHRVRA